MDNKTVIIILGPTAVGKTTLALQLAEYVNTSIISADSRQCFKELNIGVAKPSQEELALIPHYFINSHQVSDKVDAALFEKLALQSVDKIFQEKKAAVMVGGTGFYIRAFCEGLDDIPAVDSSLRVELQTKYGQMGLQWLQEEIKKNDPEYFAEAETKNPQRLLRALEIKLFTNRSILSFRTSIPKIRSFNIIKIGLQLPKDELHRNISMRTQNMMEKGLLDEVSQLIPFRELNALQTVGYSELFDHLDGNCSLQEAIERIKANTRQYAKRQITWFAKDPSIQWIDPGDWRQVKKITQS